MQVAERIVIDCLLHALPRLYRRPVSMHNPTVLAELVEAVELAEASFVPEGECGTVTTGGHLVTSEQAGGPPNL